jgi:serine/threonine-protein kinase HipA
VQSGGRKDLSVFAQYTAALLATHSWSVAIYHHRGGGFGLTPLYDVLSTWPVVGKRADQLDIHELKLAMTLRGKKAHSSASRTSRAVCGSIIS